MAQERDRVQGVPEDAEVAGEGGGASIAIGFYIAGVVMVYGTALVLYGLLGSAEYQKSLGININLWWGLFMVLFGCVILGLSYASPRRRAAREALSGGRASRHQEAPTSDR